MLAVFPITAVLRRRLALLGGLAVTVTLETLTITLSLALTITSSYFASTKRVSK
jgi:hypothetical protein